MKIHNVEQGSKEWHELRKGKMTASHAQAIGANGAGLKTYILQMMSEYYSQAKREDYTNADLERGHELEPHAREVYEMMTGKKVEQVGFIEVDEYVGCSPDGLIDDDGGIEIKCPNDKNYFKLLIDQKVDSKYVWQIQMNMLVTGRTWWHAVFFNPNFEKSIIIVPIKIDEEAQKKLSEGLRAGREQILSIKEKLS